MHMNLILKMQELKYLQQFHHESSQGLVMSPGQKFLTWVRSGQSFVARVRSAIY